jgi:cytochrome c peroxidase
MTKINLIIGLTFAVMLTAVIGVAAEKSSAELGQQLFSDAALGGSADDKSCNSCHAEGKGLEKAGANAKLTKAINDCLTGQMGGEKIDGRTASMRSLKMYVESLAVQ